MLCSLLALHNAMRIGPVTFIEELRGRYGADYAAAGNVVGAYTLAYGFAQLLAGLLTDRVGSRRLMLAGLGLAAAGSATFAVTDSYSVAVLARLVMGVAGGCLYTPTSRTRSRPSRMRSAAAQWALRRRGSGPGRSSRSWGSLPSLPAIGLTPAFLHAPAGSTRPRSRRGPRASLPSRLRPGHPRARIRDLARERDFWLLAVGFAFVGMLAQVAVLSWMPTYLRQIHGFGVVAAGWSRPASW